MGDEGTSPDSPGAPIGRVRLADPGATTPHDGGATDPAAGGWSLAGAGIALLLVLIMVGALLIILWAAFQTRA